MPIPDKIGDERIVGAAREVVLLVCADNWGDPMGFRDLSGRHVAQPEMAYQPFLG